MRHKLLLLLAAAVLMPLATGCGATSRVVRGQAPAEAVAVGQTAAPMYDDSYIDDDCEYLCDDSGRCHGPGCKCHMCLPYHIPCDLSYPPMGDMPGVVQYPYYTCKGPDCFFYQGSTTR